MSYSFTNLTKTVILVSLLIVSTFAVAQDGTIYPFETPAENQPATESWFRQWGDPRARNITKATLTPFLPKAGKANGAAVIVAPGGGFRWLSLSNEGWEVAQALADRGIAARTRSSGSVSDLR